jgi:hypothetical protein
MADEEWDDIQNIYPDDVVTPIGKPDRVGLVMNVAGISDSESDEEEYEQKRWASNVAARTFVLLALPPAA